MATDPHSIMVYCAVIAVAFWLFGLIALAVAVKKAKPEFRVKGYLRTPTGARWFRFLLYREYDVFERPGVRFFFSITHACMLGTFVALGAACVLAGSEFVLVRLSH